MTRTTTLQSKFKDCFMLQESERPLRSFQEGLLHILVGDDPREGLLRGYAQLWNSVCWNVSCIIIRGFSSRAVNQIVSAFTLLSLSLKQNIYFKGIL